MWAVGNSGLVMVRDPKTEAWSPRSVGVTNALYTVWISPAGEAWIAGTLRTLLRVATDAGIASYNIRPYDLATYTDITGSTDDSIWVTGLYSQNATFDGGVIIHYLATPP